MYVCTNVSKYVCMYVRMYDNDGILLLMMKMTLMIIIMMMMVDDYDDDG